MICVASLLLEFASLSNVGCDTNYCHPGCGPSASLIKVNPVSASSTHASSSPTGQSTWTSNTSRSLFFPISASGANMNDSLVNCTRGRRHANTTMKAGLHKWIRSLLSDSIPAIISQTACHVRTSPVSTSRNMRDISDFGGGAKCVNLSRYELGKSHM